ncbi:MAG: mannose-1-phosphate guanylyltransferase [Rubrobacteridae bacterium]|nr:mannose-1-phosphate guanylyltransferase [Rubrobacteridae bacterium]
MTDSDNSMKTEGNSKNLYGMILAGGSGTRFWPLSREMSPKQLLRVFGTESLIWQTIKRLLPLMPQEQVYVASGIKLAEEIRTHLMTGSEPFNNVGYLIEPHARNTAPAIGLAATHLYNLDKDAVMVVLPSDHLLGDPEEFLEIIKHAEKLARNDYLVTLGIKPTRPETGFGYIKLGVKLEKYSDGYDSHIVDRFVEKPDRENAERYLKSGEYFWNSGMFVFKASTILDEMKKYMPALHDLLAQFAKLSADEWAS